MSEDAWIKMEDGSLKPIIVSESMNEVVIAIQNQVPCISLRKQMSAKKASELPVATFRFKGNFDKHEHNRIFERI